MSGFNRRPHGRNFRRLSIGVCAPLGLLLCAVLAGSEALADSREPAASREIRTRRLNYSAEGQAVEIQPDRLIVKLSAPAASKAAALPQEALPRGIAELDSFLVKHGIDHGRRVMRDRGLPTRNPELFDKLGLGRIYVLELPQADEALVRQLVEKLAAKPWVEYAEPAYVGRARLTPNDQRFTLQWYMNNTAQQGGTPDADVDGPEGWEIATGNASGVVAILDTGVDLTHEDLVDNIAPGGYDYVNDDPLPQDDEGHGTAVAGIAAARGNNFFGIAGVCWGCGILPMKVLDNQGGGTSQAVLIQDLAQAIRDAADAGADTINMSLGFGNVWSQTLIDAVDYAKGVGTLTLAAMGNLNARDVDVPGALPNVVGVGGTDKNDHRWVVTNSPSGSTWGDHAEIGGPSTNITTTVWGGGLPYTNGFSGTSASTPLAAGLGALLRSMDPDLHVNELRHLLRLGADDEVGDPAEDTAGWDDFMGYGRLNMANTLALIDGPWVALDRPHYVCAGDLIVAVKDTAFPGTLQVTLTGDLSGDTETLDVDPLTAGGYHEGAIPLSWTDVDGPVAVEDGFLDVQHNETVTVSYDGMTSTAFLDCMKTICRWSDLRIETFGDCDDDGTADPGELWSIGIPLVNVQTEVMSGAVMLLESQSPWVEVLDTGLIYGDILPLSGLIPVADEESGFRIRVKAGAPADTKVTLKTTILGIGWDADDADCSGIAFPSEFELPINRDVGAPTGLGWDFDDGTAQGFTHEAAHGNGDLAECVLNPASGFDSWGSTPASDRSHSGSFSMRLGDGAGYMHPEDAGLISPSFAVPAGGGVLGFYSWNDAELADPFGQAFDGLILEAKRTADTTWSYVADASYDNTQFLWACFADDVFPFGTSDRVRMWAGDGLGPDGTGDVFDREHFANLGAFAGETIQVRFRFGSDDWNQGDFGGQGVWVDSIVLREGYAADAWPGVEPAGAQGTAGDPQCATSYDLAWNAVPGAGGYRIYRSLESCTEAQRSFDVYDTTAATSYSDTDVVEGVAYFYAVEAFESGAGCPTERSCVTGGCVDCVGLPDPASLMLERTGSDIELTWDDPDVPTAQWDLLRGSLPDPATWGAPYAQGVTDEDGLKAGIQHTDLGAIDEATSLFYLATSGGCAPCGLPVDPGGLRLERDADDVLLEWTDAGTLLANWDVYRNFNKDTSTWAAPHAIDVGDAEPGEPGIQYRDVGGISAGFLQFYLVTEKTLCGGESPLR